MKKADMIKKIQKKDAKLYLQTKQYESLFGRDSHLATAYQNEWMAIYKLMKELAIESDFSLPEWDKAMETMGEIKMVEQFEADDFAKRDIGYPL